METQTVFLNTALAGDRANVGFAARLGKIFTLFTINSFAARTMKPNRRYLKVVYTSLVFLLFLHDDVNAQITVFNQAAEPFGATETLYDDQNDITPYYIDIPFKPVNPPRDITIWNHGPNNIAIQYFPKGTVNLPAPVIMPPHPSKFHQVSIWNQPMTLRVVIQKSNKPGPGIAEFVWESAVKPR